jgi:GNAT superfamily N-acetyltransferase
MSVRAIRVETLSAGEAERHLSALAEILADVVAAGASVNFMAPFTHDDAQAYWKTVVPNVAAGRFVLLGAFVDDALVGTVQLHLASQPNQPHRADVAKLLVHRRAQRCGVGRALMTRIETLARERGRSLLTLDTITGGAGESLYQRLGWTRLGIIPGYALFPMGELGDATFFYKHLA